MPKEAAAAVAAGSVDPLSELTGLSLFPRTIRASADAPVTAAPKDLDSIHNIMKSLKELRSPEKLMCEAKKIVDGGAIVSNFSSFVKNVNATNDVAPKVKDRPRGARPGLGLVYKKASFSLRNSISQPPANLEPTLDIDSLRDPDAYFDAYERIEKAKKEILKQQGVNTDIIESIDLYKPSNYVRHRRPGILGRSYNNEHRYPSMASENDDTWMSSQETMDQDIPPKDDLPKKLVDPDPNNDANSEEVELAESMKKTESQVIDLLEELLSCNDKDLEGQGALNILQERLKIKTFDLENLCSLTELPDVGRSNILNSSGSRQKHRISLVFDSVLKNLNKKPRMEQENMENSVIRIDSPTPPRSPFGSISLLKNKILQPNPLSDPFSPLDINQCAVLNSSPAQPEEKLLGQVATPKDLGICNELESSVKFCNTKPALYDIDSQKVMENAGSLPKQSPSENASMERESGSSKATASPTHPKDKPVGQVDVPKDLSMFTEMESNVEFDPATPPPCNLDTQEVTGNAVGLPEHLEDANANIPSINASSRKNEELNSKIRKVMNSEENESNPFVVEEDARDDTSTKWQIVPEQQPEVHPSKRQRGKQVAGVKRIRDAHPMRKSLAEAGTSFEAGVRRSTRFKSRPLEYWKGERFLYARIDNSLKLIGLKYISPGNGIENLKVKPYNLSEKPELKELLDLAARH